MGEPKKMKNTTTKETLQKAKILFRQYKKLWKREFKIAKIQQPVVHLARRNGDVEYYQKAIKGEYEFKHSDGETRKITLHPRYILTFKHGDETYKGYWCHEDHPVPLPNNPVILGETFQEAIDKGMSAVSKWKAKEWEAKSGMVMKIGLAIGAVILAYALYTMLKPQNTGPATETAVTTAKTIIRNATILG